MSVFFQDYHAEKVQVYPYIPEPDLVAPEQKQHFQADCRQSNSEFCENPRDHIYCHGLLIKARTNKKTNKGLKQSTVTDMRNCMKKDLGDWQKKPVTSITRSMVQKRHLLLGEKSQARANLSMRYLRAILNYISELHADDNGNPLLSSNPVKILSATKQWFEIKSRDTYLKEHEIKPYIQAVMNLTEPPETMKGAVNGRTF